ncbi:hypothetical protein [Acinetobacter junii]|uniref:hypothetical protein n=1 Tax=Acinetobacter junii TaxID=40215 RepID=UPI003214FA2D
MFEWFEDRLERAFVALKEFPKLILLIIFLVFLAFLSFALFERIVLAFYNLGFGEQYLFRPWIERNNETLGKIQYAIPLFLLIIAYPIISSLHDNMHFKKYGCFPRWEN